MDLKTYIKDTAARRRLAETVGTSYDYLWQLATGWRGRRPSRITAFAIERATDGAVTRQELRPDIWPPDDKQKETK